MHSPGPLYILCQSWNGSFRSNQWFLSCSWHDGFHVRDFWFLLHLKIYSYDRIYVYETPLTDHFRSPLSAQTLIQVQTYTTSPSAYVHTFHLQLWLLIDPTKRPNLGFIPTQGQPRGRGVLLPQVVNFGAIQGRSQWTRSPLFLPTYEMLLRWLPQGQVFQAEQSPAVSYGQLWNAAFF